MSKWLSSYSWLAGAFAVVMIGSCLEWRATYVIARTTSGGLERKWLGLSTALLDVIYMPMAIKKKSCGAPQDRTRLLLVGGSIGGVFIGIIAPHVLVDLNPVHVKVWHYVGVGLIAAGAALRICSVRRLGLAAHRVVYADEKISLITTGPYAVIRNPAYAGSLVAYLGMGVALGNIVSVLACGMLPFVARLPRIFAEERTLRSVHGEQYAEYARHVKRFVPGLW